MQIKSDYFGKYCEHKIFSELLREHFDVFTTVIDNKGIDCVVRKNKDIYLDIQIKGRQPRWIFTLDEFEPSKNYFFILIPPDEKIYVIPSEIIFSWVDIFWKVYCTRERKNIMSEKYEYKEYGDFKKLLHF